MEKEEAPPEEAPPEEAPPEEEFKRFILDLEFVQCLANPMYLKFLAQHRNKYFKEEAFIQYLRYLLYWKQPEYARFIRYPYCLHMLQLLQDENFRNQLANPTVIDLMYKQQMLHWQFYRSNKLNGDKDKPPKSENVVSQDGKQ